MVYKDVFVIESKPLGGWQKLLNGFCDPQKTVEDDDEDEVTTTSSSPTCPRSPEDSSKKNIFKPNLKVRQVSFKEEESEEVVFTYEKDNEETEEKEVAKKMEVVEAVAEEQRDEVKTEEPQTKEVDSDSKIDESLHLTKQKAMNELSQHMRAERSWSVLVFAFLVVSFTIYSLHLFGFTTGFSVKGTPGTPQPKKLINIEKKVDYEDKARESLQRLKKLVSEIKEMEV
jgi:hypothetical protein